MARPKFIVPHAATEEGKARVTARAATLRGLQTPPSFADDESDSADEKPQGELPAPEKKKRTEAPAASKRKRR